MILQELLQQANCREIAKIWAFHKLPYDESYNITALTLRLNDFVTMLLHLDAIPSNDNVLVATQNYDGDKQTLDIPVYNIDSLRRTIEWSKDTEVPDISADMSTFELDMICEGCTTRCVVEACAYDFEPWEEVLGYRVLELNAERVGIQRFLAFVLWHMSSNGFKKEEQGKRRKELEGRKPIEDFLRYGVSIQEKEKEKSEYEESLDCARTTAAWLKELQTIGEEKEL